MKALSIVSPNGSRIAKGYKTLEIRSWEPDLKFDEDFLIVENERYLQADEDIDTNGKIVAVAKIKKIRKYVADDIPSACATVWSEGYFSWELSDVRPVSYSAQVEAKRGLYNLEVCISDLKISDKTEAIFDEAFYQTRFFEMLKRNELVAEVLKRSASLGVESWAFGAGFIQQSIFNLLHGKPVLEGIKDIDWVYFDSENLSEESEAQVIALVKKAMSDIPIPFDVKNQARVHLWYKNKFGYDIQPYSSLEHAISTWPTTSTAIAVTGNGAQFQVIAPFGFSDLMTMTIRPNKKQITKEIYLAKLARWQRYWPQARTLSWEES